MLLLLFNQGSGVHVGTLIVTEDADVLSAILAKGSVPLPPAYLTPSRRDYGWYNGRPPR